MHYTPAYVAPSQAAARTLFGHVMWLVAATAGCFALGCYAGRDLSGGWSIVWFLAGFGCLIALNFARRASSGASVALLLAMGLFLGLGMGPAVAYYTVTSPRAVWQASGATALFMAGCGTYGYATRRDLGMVGRVSFFALLGLILLSIVLIFIRIPGADLGTRSSASSSSPALRCTISSASGGHGAWPRHRSSPHRFSSTV